MDRPKKKGNGQIEKEVHVAGFVLTVPTRLNITRNIDALVAFFRQTVYEVLIYFLAAVFRSS